MRERAVIGSIVVVVVLVAAVICVVFSGGHRQGQALQDNENDSLAASGNTQCTAGNADKGTIGEMTESQAFDQFLNNELPVFSSIDGETGIFYDDYSNSGFLEEEEHEISRLDLDNDGDEELVIRSVGHYGAAVIDFKENILYFLAQGEGTAGICSYTFIAGEAWIVHSDTSHAGRQVFLFEKFNGNGEITDQFTLSAEYWDEPGDSYTENSDFTYRDEKITMQEYENLRMIYMGW